MLFKLIAKLFNSTLFHLLILYRKLSQVLICLNLVRKSSHNKLFNNGILYYHKNRLIKRHKVELGNFLLNFLIQKYRSTDYSESNT